LKVLYKNKYVLDLEDTLSLHIPPTLACVSWPASSAGPRCVMGRSRTSWESCKMNKCCFEPSSLKKAVLFVQRWCGQQTLSLKNASFHVLRVASLIYKFHAAFLYPVYIQDYVEIYLLT
jgi:hypothetical protein